MLSSYLRYTLHRKSAYQIHSPFVYDFVVKVLNDKGFNEDYNLISRMGYMLDGRKRISFRNRKLSRFLYRLVRYFEPNAILSFGTLSALSASALALGNLKAKLYTEQSQEFVDAMNALGVVNVERLRPSDLFSEKFKSKKMSCVFFSYDAFNSTHWNKLTDCLLRRTSDAVFIFERIHGSSDIEDAWEMICKDEAVTLSMDLYYYGLVFFKVGFEKSDYVLKW